MTLANGGCGCGRVAAGPFKQGSASQGFDTRFVSYYARMKSHVHTNCPPQYKNSAGRSHLPEYQLRAPLYKESSMGLYIHTIQLLFYTGRFALLEARGEAKGDARG